MQIHNRSKYHTTLYRLCINVVRIFVIVCYMQMQTLLHIRSNGKWENVSFPIIFLLVQCFTSWHFPITCNWCLLALWCHQSLKVFNENIIAQGKKVTKYTKVESKQLCNHIWLTDPSYRLGKMEFKYTIFFQFSQFSFFILIFITEIRWWCVFHGKNDKNRLPFLHVLLTRMNNKIDVAVYIGMGYN